MKQTATVLIVIDGTEGIRRAATRLEESLGGMRVVVKNAVDFSATDLLPAEAFFLGCESPHPPGFAELERVMKGINLAGRACGLFSLASKEAIGYLRAVVRDAELRLNPQPYFAEGAEDPAAWTAETIRRR